MTKLRKRHVVNARNGIVDGSRHIEPSKRQRRASEDVPTSHVSVMSQTDLEFWEGKATRCLDLVNQYRELIRRVTESTCLLSNAKQLFKLHVDLVELANMDTEIRRYTTGRKAEFVRQFDLMRAHYSKHESDFLYQLRETCRSYQIDLTASGHGIVIKTMRKAVQKASEDYQSVLALVMIQVDNVPSWSSMPAFEGNLPGDITGGCEDLA